MCLRILESSMSKPISERVLRSAVRNRPLRGAVQLPSRLRPQDELSNIGEPRVSLRLQPDDDRVVLSDVNVSLAGESHLPEHTCWHLLL